MLKVLSIGSDKNLFVKDSDAQKRMRNYGKLFSELHIIVFTTRKSQIPNLKSQISENVFAYPTNSKNKLLYIWDAYRIGKTIIDRWKLIIGNSVITAQDPFESGLVGWALKKKFNLPLQLQIHADIFSPYLYQESLKNKFRVWLAKFLLPKADGIRVVSERIKRSLITQLPNYQLLYSQFLLTSKKSSRLKLKWICAKNIRITIPGF